MAMRQVLQEQLRLHNSFYLYEESKILDATARLSAAFPSAQFLYSMKCNPAGRVLDTVFGQGFGADAASLREVDMAEARGVPARLICFSAPARTEEDLRSAYGRCTLIADSLREVALIARIAAERGETAEIGVRINPDFTFAGETGVAGKFGIDEDALWAADLSAVRVIGIHVHAKSQELSADVLAHYYENMFRLIERVQTRLGVTLRFANLGSGLGIPFAPGETELNVETLGARFETLCAACRAAWPTLAVYIETGRYAVGKSGVYVTRVLDKKVSHGKTFLLLHNTMNGFSRPAVAQMVRGFTDKPFPYEPLFTHVDASELVVLTDTADRETVTLAGNLCTSADIIAKDILLPKMEVGDGLMLTNAGCYAAVMTPMQFASLTPPAQLFLQADGQVTEA